jgi:hypothetical protein
MKLKKEVKIIVLFTTYNIKLEMTFKEFINETRLIEQQLEADKNGWGINK